jgi:ligand-binding sensor domain-containing protein
VKLAHFVFAVVFIFTGITIGYSQYPECIVYNNENGIPSDEVYSILQDHKGMIWIGCDAGLFKFDGVRYIQYRSRFQNSKSISTLTASKSGRIYCVNFQDQLFYVDGDSLLEIPHTMRKISHIVADQKGRLYVNFRDGTSVLDANNRGWRRVNAADEFHSSINVDKDNTILYLDPEGYIRYTHGVSKHVKVLKSNDHISSFYTLVQHSNEIWILGRVKNVVYKFVGDKLQNQDFLNLRRLLENKKITRAKFLSDGKLWIATYTGIIYYDTKTDEGKILYPDISFSDMIVDREGNYWFTTLQAGVMKVPNLQVFTWNRGNMYLNNEKVNLISNNKTHIFFTTLNGTIGKLNTNTHQLTTFHTGHFSDIQSLDYDSVTNKLYFNINNNLFYLEDDVIRDMSFACGPLKSIKRIKDEYIILTSWNIIAKNSAEYTIDNSWGRQLSYDKKHNHIWIASNSGILRLEHQAGVWRKAETYLNDFQILSIDLYTQDNLVYALAFDGNIYRVGDNNYAENITKLPDNIQGNRFKISDNRIYVATNKGVWFYDLRDKYWRHLNSMLGIALSNVHDLVILNKVLWLAGSRGLQNIRIQDIKEPPLAKVYLDNIDSYINVQYDSTIVLKPEVSIYSANGNYKYAYKLNENGWIYYPSTIENIEISNIPSGDFEIKFKVVDHLGRDSENLISISGVSISPFWKTIWFIVSVIFIILDLLFLVFYYLLSRQKRKLNRRNQLNIEKLKAIRSQMNPHFIFNSLNSIQDLILQNKTVESYDYVVLFSDLVRDALVYSNEEFISISQEIVFLHNYLELEKLRFKDDFSFSIHSNVLDEMEVPSLLIQPFVENAVLHGLLHKKGLKWVKINFELDNNRLMCIIEDNGIGRQQAEILQKRMGSNHLSFAMNAIQTRLELYSSLGDKTISSFLYQDILSGDEVKGTRIVITLPYIKRF